MSPFWTSGQSIDVLAGEPPVEFRWHHHRHRVQQVSDHWRIHLDWWGEEVWRDYWEVTTGSGLWCVLYHDLLADHWYLERIYE